MKTFILCVLLSIALNMFACLVALARGTAIKKGPKVLMYSVIEGVIWIGSGIYLLARG